MEPTSHTPFLGTDVGKGSHWARLMTRKGEVVFGQPIANHKSELDTLFSQAPDALLVVDQVRNIVAFSLRRAESVGLDTAHPPCLAAHGAAKLFADEDKTDERDAIIIARTALGIPNAILPATERDVALDAAKSTVTQGGHVMCCSMRDSNCPRSILLESRPSFETLVDRSYTLPPPSMPFTTADATLWRWAS